MDCMVETLKMLVFGSWEEATSKSEKSPTTTRWVDPAMKDDEGLEVVRCRLAARDFNPRYEGP